MVIARPLRLADEVRVLHLGHEQKEPLCHSTYLYCKAKICQAVAN